MSALRSGSRIIWALALALFCLVVPILAVGAPAHPDPIAAPNATPPPVDPGYDNGIYQNKSSAGGNPTPKPAAPKPTPSNGATPANNATPSNPPPPNPAPCGYGPTGGVVTGTGGFLGLSGPSPCPAPPPPPLTPATSPPPDLTQYYAQIFQEIATSPGTISAAPPNHTGLVNLPTCFWLTGQAVPHQKQVTMDLKGAPDSAGQQITYHITLTVTLQHTNWGFGDGSESQTPAPTECVGISGDPPSLVAHEYVSYSSPDFMVTASETFAGSVTMTWTDSNGPQAPPPVAGPTQTITTDPYPIKVDQEEGLGTG